MSDHLPALTKQDFTAAQIGALLPANITEVITVAKTLFVSKLFPDLQNAEQAVAKIMAGAEMGIPPIAALNSFHIVKGKIMTHYSAIAGGIRRAGYDYRVLEHSETLCRIEFLGRDKEPIGTHEFTQMDAKKASTQNMDRLPKVMLFARCISQGARFYVPEAFNGMIVYEHSERGLIEEEADAESEPIIGASTILAAKVVDHSVPDEYDPLEDLQEALVLTEDYSGPTVQDDEQEALI